MADVPLPAPQSWKEWTRAGVLQAFIIAFYTEMYGLPLTIYFLARFVGLDIGWREGGNLWAQIFGTPVAHVVAIDNRLHHRICRSNARSGWMAENPSSPEKRKVGD